MLSVVTKELSDVHLDLRFVLYVIILGIPVPHLPAVVATCAVITGLHGDFVKAYVQSNLIEGLKMM